jgi:drug/metabolite transporter (DMT)-like permease
MPKLALVLLFVTPLFFASNMLAARAFSQLVPPLTMAWGRWLVALVVSLLMLPNARALLGVMRGPARWRVVALGALGMAFCGPAVYAAGQTTTAINIGLIYCSSPIFITVLSAVWLKEAVSARLVLGSLAAFLGVSLILTRGEPVARLSELHFVAGDLWTLAAALAWAVYSVLLKSTRSQASGRELFSATCAIGVVLLTPLSVLEHLSTALTLSWQAAALLTFLGVVPSLLAYRSYELVQNDLGANVAGLTMYLVPFYNGLLAVLLLGERVRGYHWLGGALLLAGIAFCARSQRKTGAAITARAA